MLLHFTQSATCSSCCRVYLFLSRQLINSSSLPLTWIIVTTRISPVWGYLIRLASLSAAPAEVPEGAGGVRVACRAVRAADRVPACCWISTCFCQSPENSHWSTNISIFITPRLHSPGCGCFLVTFQFMTSVQFLLFSRSYFTLKGWDISISTSTACIPLCRSYWLNRLNFSALIWVIRLLSLFEVIGSVALSWTAFNLYFLMSLHPTNVCPGL